ncbi:Armadillo/beta-catenin-like repeat family protein [Trichomonas vaginalis G3]|uniref:Armadillo/beta-catenin-like repeat family protein n=1 Tax=Trichomonas vaginalis (strain ATCC PRA-98 / G3) TaxID=412133 RepID=A2DJA9_TRIV3|nr:sperm-associated antigen 6 family [Trichomonas vaginalis G3]EAY19496.1 Armadillo/beta-catenin-like repeat family protein [Trichomonas vaginalis G3]KAI5520022.1 sperm-associated antigen 6 family [Trichomonas vaginalis G3]|eukprot:XP_001580482.1 Armadillo/beta-catenin-like repeat family protein [Trichomonas vaginalis G3]
MSKQLIRDFDAYKKARHDFVSMVSEAAMKPDNINTLIELNVLSLLRPLLLDNVPSIQQMSALAISRLANVSEKNSEKIITTGMLPEIVNGLNSKDERYQKNLCQVIRSVSKHSQKLATKVVAGGCLKPLVECLKSESNVVCEAASSSIKAIAAHDSNLAQEVVEAGALAPLIKSINRAENTLRRTSISAIGSISRHTPQLAQACIEAKAIPTIASLLSTTNDSKLKTQACLALANIATHSVDTAELVVEEKIFPSALTCFTDADADLRVAAAKLVLEIVKHTQELAQGVVGFGGCQSLVEYIRSSKTDMIPAVKAVGAIASFSPSLALSLLEAGAGRACLGVFVSSKSAECKAVAARTVGMLGKHNAQTSLKISSMNALSLLFQAMNDPDGDEELRAAVKEAMVDIIKNCEDITALEPLITTSEGEILCHVLERISNLLSKNPKVRAPFVSSGGFRSVQLLQADNDPNLKKLIDAINDCYPDQAVRFYSPNYVEELNKEVDAHKI